MEDEKQVQHAIKDLLNKFAELEPNAAKDLTKRIPRDKRGTLEGKKLKVGLIAKQYPDAFERIAKQMFPESASNPLGYSSNSLINSIMKLTREEAVGGSFGTSSGPVFE